MSLKTCTRPAGSVAAYAKVEIRLSQDTVVTATSANYLASPIEVTAAADGSVSVQLQANGDLTPNNTYFTVTEYAGTTDSTYTVVVPQTAGPFVLTAIISPPPAVGATWDATLVHLAGSETITGVKTYSAAPIFNAGATFPSSGGVVAMGTGDDVPYLTLNGVAWEMTSQQGTAAGPITTGAGPNVKISRTESITAATMPGGIGANNEGNAGLWVSAIGDAANEAQVAALLGTARTQSTVTPTGGKNRDACAVQGFANVFGSGTGVAGGAYFEGRRDVSTGSCDGVELRCNNNTAVDGAYTAVGFNNTMGAWIACGSNTNPGNLSALAIGIAGVNTCQWDVGIGFSQLGGAGGTSGGVKNASIRDDGQALYSYLINGTHATASIAVGASSGVALFGGTAALGGASTRLEVQGSASASALPLVFIGNTTGTFSHCVDIRNQSGVFRMGVVGGASTYLTNSAAGDFALQNTTSAKRVLIGGTTIVVSVKNDNTLGFFGVTETAQIAGSTDVLAGLVTLGLRAASSNPPLDLGTGLLSAGSVTVAGAGPILVGGASQLGGAQTRLEVIGASGSSSIPLIFIGNTSGAFSHSIDIRNSGGVFRMGIVGGNGTYLASSVGGDFCIQNTTGSKRVLIGGTSIVISVTNGNTLGFFNKAEVAQYATTGTSTGFTAGAGTTVTHLSTFTGNNGATAYTIGDIVNALKLYGLMAV